MITKVWEDDFQAFLVDFVLKNFGGGRSAAVLPDTLKPVLMCSWRLRDAPMVLWSGSEHQLDLRAWCSVGVSFCTRSVILK